MHIQGALAEPKRNTLSQGLGVQALAFSPQKSMGGVLDNDFASELNPLGVSHPSKTHFLSGSARKSLNFFVYR